MKIAKLLTDVKPSQTFLCSKQEAMSKCLAALQSEDRYILQDVDPEEGEIKVLYGAKKNYNLKLYRFFFKNLLFLFRFSFEESIDGNTIVTTALSCEDGSQNMFDFGEYYENRIKRILSKM